MTTPDPNGSRTYWPGLIAGLLGVVYALGLTTHYPVSVSPDGVSYLELARHLVEGLGPRTLDEAGNLTIVTHWPPLYPLCLAGLSSLLGIEPLVSARILAALTLGASLLLFDRILLRFAPSPLVRSLGLALLFASFPFVVYTRALSEGLFITLLFALTLCLLRFDTSGRRDLLFLAGILGGLMFLSRYAAVGFLGGAALFLLARDEPFQKRLTNFFIVFVPSALIASAWLIYTLLEGANPSNRSVAFHFVSYHHVVVFVKTFLAWLSPADRNLGFVLLALLCALGAMVTRIRPAIGLRDLPPAFGPIAWLSGAYVLFLIFSVTFVDYHTQFNYRILAPVFPFIVLMSLPFWKKAFSETATRRLATAILLLIGGSTLFAFATRSVETFESGHYYTSEAWIASPSLAHVGSIPMERRVYTNGPDPIRLLRGFRPAVVRLPTRFEATSRAENTEFQHDMEVLHEQLRSGKAVILYFDAIYRTYLPNEGQLRARFPDIPVREFDDGFAIGHPPR